MFSGFTAAAHGVPKRGRPVSQPGRPADILRDAQIKRVIKHLAFHVGRVPAWGWWCPQIIGRSPTSRHRICLDSVATTSFLGMTYVRQTFLVDIIRFTG